jgi:phage internal scaffolding protein
MTFKKTDFEHKRVLKEFPLETLTEQQHKDTCDMHRIMGQQLKTGIIDHVARYKGQYGDYASSLDLHTAMNIISDAASMFETVPAQIRNKFGNDAGAFVDFMNDNRNYEAIAEMGLDVSHLTPPPEKPPEASTTEVPPDASSV